MILQKSCDAVITTVASLSSHDGPGLRTTVFFKGCSLRCRWCHNPETIHRTPELEWDRRLCIGCRTCSSLCKSGAIDFSENQKSYPIDKRRCVQCFDCVDRCPARALKITGKTYSLKMLEELILKDEKLMKAMSGGVTFSGGEPALQSEFITWLSAHLKEKGLHLALDTCGQAPWENYEQLLPLMDLLLFDLKEMNPSKHSDFTGSDNRLILENLFRICESISNRQLSTRLWIRTPLIPELTASRENIEAIGRFIDRYLSAHVDRWELCSFNNLCKDKYNRLGVQWCLADADLLSENRMNELLTLARQSAPSIKCITASGLNVK